MGPVAYNPDQRGVPQPVGGEPPGADPTTSVQKAAAAHVVVNGALP